MIDYRRVRLSNLTSPEFSHLLWLLYWPVHGILFAALELLRPVADCHPVWCPLDDWIPFNEWFLIPYLFWFLYLAGVAVYLVLYDGPACRRFMQFVTITYAFTLVCYLIWPTCQNLRPESFARDNFLTRFMAAFYAFDTNTNVCPSLHVIGAFAAAFGTWDTPRFRAWPWRLLNLFLALLISVSTVFVKQHSVVDVLTAFAVSGVGYFLVYVLPARKRKKAAVHEPA